jgi:hypothetical protein
MQTVDLDGTRSERISITSHDVLASSPSLSRRPRVFFATEQHNRGGRDESAFTRVFNALLPGHDRKGTDAKTDRNPS